MNNTTYDAYLVTEEFITAEEYLKRRERGEITPSDVRIVQPDIRTGQLGGFMVKLKQPVYKTDFKPVTPVSHYVW